MTPCLRATAGTLAIACMAACGGRAKSAPPAASAASVERAIPALWSDVLIDERRDVVIRANPRDLYEDPVFGGMLKRGVDVAIGEAHSRGAIGQALEVLARASDISVAVREREGRDVVAVLYGVPGEFSPTAMKDEKGLPLFIATQSSAEGALRGVRVYAGTRPDLRMRVYELPGSTWVLAIGEGAARADDVLAHAQSFTYVPPLHPPLSVRISGDVLQSLKARSGPALRPAVIGLERALLTMTHRSADMTEAQFRMELAYKDVKQAEAAEPTVRKALPMLLDYLGLGVAPKIERELASLRAEVVVRTNTNAAR